MMHYSCFLSTVRRLASPLGYMERICYLLLLGGRGPIKGNFSPEITKPSDVIASLFLGCHFVSI